MATIPVESTTIKYRGIFDLDGLLRTMRSWMEGMYYEFQETKLVHKVPSPAGAELELKVQGTKKVNEYVKFTMKAYFHIYDIKKMEIIKDGQKKKVVQARMLLDIDGVMDLDYGNRFGGSKFLQGLHDWYTKFIIHKEIDNIWADQLCYRVYQLHRVVKAYLDMETKTNAAENRW